MSTATTRRRPARWALIALLTACLLAACGGSSGKKAAAPNTGQANTEASTSTTGAPAAATQDTATTSTTAVASASSGGAKVTATTAKKAATKTTTKITAAPQQQKLSSGIQNVTGTPTTVAPRADIQPGGTLTVRKPGDIAGWDPILLSNSGLNDGTIGTALYDVLISTNSSDGSLTPGTATSLTSSDAVNWVMKLRPNIRFSDGTPYDAAAVKFNWERLQDPKNAAALASQATLIQSMSVADPTTLNITLKAANARFANSVTLMTFIGSPTAINNDPQFRSRPVGAGAFTMKQWIQGTSITLARNPNYWNAPRPYLDQVIFKIIPDEQQGVNSYKAGEMQFEQTLIAGAADQIIKSGGVPHNVVINGGPNLYFNTSKAPFNDVRARQAFIMGIDRADYDKVIQAGLIDPIDSIFRPGSAFYDPALVQFGYDPVKAQQLFSAVAADTGGPVSFDISSYNSGGYDLIGQYFQGALSKFKDVKVTLSLASVAAHTADLNNGNFQAGVAGNPFVDPEPTMTTKYTCDASPPVTRWCNQQYDALVKDQRLTLDANQRVSDFKQIQKLLYQEAPAYYFDRRVIFYITTPAVQDVDWINDGAVLLDRIWMKR